MFDPPACCTRAFKEVAKTLPRRTRNRLFLDVHDRNGSIRATISADATADTAFGDVNFAIGMTCNSCPATQQTDRVLALPASCSNTDVANYHTLTVHTCMSMPPG